MKRTYDIVLDGFLEINLKQFTHIPVIAIYNSSKDYPGKYVARLWDIGNKPTKCIVLKDSLDEIRQVIPKTMIRLPSFPADDPVLVESYL